MGAMIATPADANHWHSTECHRLRVARGCFTPRIPPTSVGKKRAGWAGIRLASVDSDAILSVDLCRFVDLPSRTLFEVSNNLEPPADYSLRIIACGLWPAD